MWFWATRGPRSAAPPNSLPTMHLYLVLNWAPMTPSAVNPGHATTTARPAGGTPTPMTSALGSRNLDTRSVGSRSPPMPSTLGRPRPLRPSAAHQEGRPPQAQGRGWDIHSCQAPNWPSCLCTIPHLRPPAACLHHALAIPPISPLTHPEPPHHTPSMPTTSALGSRKRDIMSVGSPWAPAPAAPAAARERRPSVKVNVGARVVG